MAYSPSNLPDFSTASLNDVASWVYQELERIGEEINTANLLSLAPVGKVPNKYDEGTMCCFLAGTELPSGDFVAEKSYWVFLEGSWKQIALQEN